MPMHMHTCSVNEKEMVFFTCNACGQSIRKNRVEKHWQSECRNCEVLSCMDCGKDFHGEEYAGHTSCITEAEKYQGALFKGEKGGASKGEKKQQEWIHNITVMMSSRDFTPRIKNLLEKILDYPNIPRKKSKFQNFLKNSINVRDINTLDKLWDVFTEASQKKTEIAPSSASPSSCDINKQTQAEPEEINNCKTKKENDVVIKKKKKKTKRVEETENEIHRKDSKTGSDNDELDNSKKSKKRKDKVVVDRKRDRDDDCGDVIGKVKRKKPKTDCNGEEIRKSKKHKHKNTTVNAES